MSMSADNELVTEMEKTPTFAPSLGVPNVQEMVKMDPLHVPKRYLMSEEEMEKSNYKSHLSSEIPIIDLKLLSCGNKEELLKLDIAYKEWGFFQIVNHGVQKEIRQGMRDAADKFFKLPIEEKNKYAMLPDEREGYGLTYLATDEKTLDWSDALLLLIQPSRYRKLRFWPKTPQEFKEIIEAYTSEIERVSEEIMNSVSLNLGLEKHALLRLHKEVLHALRVNYYPPCSTPEQVQGLSPHSDTSTITILMQDYDVPGLEIRHIGNWVPVTPLPDALVVNVGDAIEIWSNGKYKSVQHRAMTNKNKKRTSYASFLCPQDDVEVEPFDHMIDAQNPKLYKKVRYGDYVGQSIKGKLEGKTHVDVARIKDERIEENQIQEKAK